MMLDTGTVQYNEPISSGFMSFFVNTRQFPYAAGLSFADWPAHFLSLVPDGHET